MPRRLLEAAVSHTAHYALSSLLTLPPRNSSATRPPALKEVNALPFPCPFGVGTTLTQNMESAILLTKLLEI